jgi:hypothetical protein
MVVEVVVCAAHGSGWSVSCPLGRRMAPAALAHDTARIDAAGVDRSRGQARRRASLTRTRGGLWSVGQRAARYDPAVRRARRGAMQR